METKIEISKIGDIVYTNQNNRLANRCHNKKVKIIDIIKTEFKQDKVKIIFLEDVHGGVNKLTVDLDMLSYHEPPRLIPKFANKDIGSEVEYITKDEHGQITKKVGVLDWIDLNCSLALPNAQVCGVKHKNGRVFCYGIEEVSLNL